MRFRTWVQALTLCLVSTALLAGAAKAQALPDLDPDQPVALVADQIVYDANSRRIVATGSVQVFYGDRTLTADSITYDDTTGRIEAEGDLVLRDETGATIFADAADLDAELRDGLIEGARAVLGAQAKLAAVEGRRVDNRYNALSKAVYSPCKVCQEDPTPLWRIRARRIIHDEEEKIIHYENATFDVLGLPIAWLPYFRHPDPTVDRASGFLVPSFENSTNFGRAIKIPFYWVIDEQSDATFTPFITTDDGPFLIAEYRRAFESGQMRLGGSIGYDDFDGEDRLRGHIDAEGLFTLGGDIEWGFDINLASDDAYLRRYDLSNEDRLTSELFLRRYRSSGYFDFAALRFQSLRDDEPAGDIPLVLPAFDTRFDVDETLLGGNVGIFMSGHALGRNTGQDAGRISLGVDWEREEITSWGMALRGFAEVRGDLFYDNDNPDSSDNVNARISPHVGLEFRYPLIWEQESGAAHIVEPVVQTIGAPFGGNGADIPIEDSLVTEFDETNVIDENHFSGLDSFEDGPRINLALRYQMISDSGLEMDATVGRVYRFRNSPAFSSGSGLSGSESDFVTAWGANFDPYFTVRHRMRFADDLTITRNEFFSAFTVDPVELRVSYIFLESDPEIGADLDREEVTADAALAIDDNWSVAGLLQRDLQLGEFVQVGGTVTYQNECCKIDFFVRRQFTDQDDVPASTSFGFRINLLTLGDSETGR